MYPLRDEVFELNGCRTIWIFSSRVDQTCSECSIQCTAVAQPKIRKLSLQLIPASAACPPRTSSGRPCRHKFFNTNNLWVNLDKLQATLDEQGGLLKLPLIKNKKTVRTPSCATLWHPALPALATIS